MSVKNSRENKLKRRKDKAFKGQELIRASVSHWHKFTNKYGRPEFAQTFLRKMIRRNGSNA